MLAHGALEPFASNNVVNACSSGCGFEGARPHVCHQASTALHEERARAACVPRLCCCFALAPSLGTAGPNFSLLLFLPPLGLASTVAGRPFSPLRIFWVCVVECAKVALHVRNINIRVCVCVVCVLFLYNNNNNYILLLFFIYIYVYIYLFIARLSFTIQVTHK